MSISDDQYNRLLERINHIEEVMDDMLTVLNKTVTASTIGKVISTFETSQDDLENRIETLEEKVTDLEEDPYSERE